VEPPFLQGREQVAASFIALGRESTTIRAAAQHRRLVDFARRSEFDPAALTCVPGASHSPSKTGVADVVIVTTMSLRAPRPGEAAGTTSSESFADIRSQNFATFSAVRE
jgi:hypothetical protein